MVERVHAQAEGLELISQWLAFVLPAKLVAKPVAGGSGVKLSTALLIQDQNHSHGLLLKVFPPMACTFFQE